MKNKKINYKKEYLREFKLRCYYNERSDKYRMKYLFWQPLGIVALVLIASIFVYVIYLDVQDILKSGDYTVVKNECSNETWKEFLCSNGEQGKLLDSTFFIIRPNLSSCYVTTNQNCIKTEVDEITINYENQITCEISIKYCDDYVPYPIVVTANGSNIEDISMEGCKGNCRKTEASTTVQVKYLTEEWLNNNCRCSKLVGVFPSDAEPSWENCIDNQCKCYEYKCGEYEVTKND